MIELLKKIKFHYINSTHVFMCDLCNSLYLKKLITAKEFKMFNSFIKKHLDKNDLLFGCMEVDTETYSQRQFRIKFLTNQINNLKSKQ